jgi:hypothetical protein
MKNTQKSPKFEIGQTVNCEPNLYGETTGTIYERERLYREINPYTGRMNGMVTGEATLKHIELKYDFDGETLTIHYPESDFGSSIQKAYSTVSKFCGWGYTVKSPKGNNTGYLERHLKSI